MCGCSTADPLGVTRPLDKFAFVTISLLYLLSCFVLRFVTQLLSAFLPFRLIYIVLLLFITTSLRLLAELLFNSFACHTTTETGAFRVFFCGRQAYVSAIIFI